LRRLTGEKAIDGAEALCCSAKVSPIWHPLDLVFAEICDFNGASEYFAQDGAGEWAQIAEIVGDLVPSFQPSRQSGIYGAPIFDPKATNVALSSAAVLMGWHAVPVPAALRAFGDAWDSGKNRTLVEWQFSNYPFLSNNVARTEVAFRQGIPLAGIEKVEALLVVTKSGVFPSSNSTLYYEQAKAQLDSATTLGVFEVPIRLVGLGIPSEADRFAASWTTYADRTSRTVVETLSCEIAVTWTERTSKFGAPMAVFRRI
jgi:hypothetical protein